MVDKETKKKFLEELEKEGLILAACRRSGLSRTTLYRWKKEDKEFSKQITKSQKIGRDNVNDLGDYSIIQLIKEKNVPIIKWYKAFNDRRYKPKPRKVIIEHSKLTVKEKELEMLWREKWDQYTEMEKSLLDRIQGKQTKESEAMLEDFLRRNRLLEDDENETT
jgi:hypothetical protein